MTKLSMADKCAYDKDDALSEEDFDALFEDAPTGPKPLCLMVQGDTGDGKTHTITKTLHEDMLPAIYLHSFKETHGFSFPDGVRPLCFESRKGEKIEDPEEAYQHLLGILYSKAINKFKTIILDSVELDHLIWEHSFVKGADKFQDSATAKQLYWEVVKRLKELNEQGTHVIVSMGITVYTDTGSAAPWLRGKPGTAIPTWFGDRLIMRMTDTSDKEGNDIRRPLWNTKTLVEKASSAITDIKKEEGMKKAEVTTKRVVNITRCRLRDIDTRPLDGKPASIKTLWNYIKKESSK